MKYHVSWTFRLGGSASENEAAAKRVLALYSKWTPPEGTTYHQFLGRADGNGGYAVIETDNPTELADVATFAPFAEWQIQPVLDVAEAVQIATEAIKFRDSIG
jgi:hypothetical protein